MRHRIKAHIDDAGAESRLAIAEVIFPKPFERRPEAELLDLRPCVEKTSSPFAQCQRIAAAKIFHRRELEARLLDRLEAKGFCRRQRSTDDRRVVRVELTPEGEVAAQEVPVVLAQVLNEHLAGFSKTEWSQLKDMLRRMVINGDAAETRNGE